MEETKLLDELKLAERSLKQSKRVLWNKNYYLKSKSKVWRCSVCSTDGMHYNYTFRDKRWLRVHQNRCRYILTEIDYFTQIQGYINANQSLQLTESQKIRFQKYQRSNNSQHYHKWALRHVKDILNFFHKSKEINSQETVLLKTFNSKDVLKQPISPRQAHLYYNSNNLLKKSVTCQQPQGMNQLDIITSSLYKTSTIQQNRTVLNQLFKAIESDRSIQKLFKRRHLKKTKQRNGVRVRGIINANKQGKLNANQFGTSLWAEQDPILLHYMAFSEDDCNDLVPD